ncbi:fumarylacetoacetase [Corticibacter populi]|uniref:fumarylacetoacetase n=1 Tax=Corticibacter populi TaxID=1550736 RepID=UPI0030FEEFA1
MASANTGTTDFPIQNLPLGVFSTAVTGPRVGVAIGDQVLDLPAAHDLGLLGDAVPRELLEQDSLNALFAAGHGTGLALRHAVFRLLHAQEGLQAQAQAGSILHAASAVRLHLPTRIGNYTDFYAGIHHAVRAGSLLQPENPLPENYKWMPIGYHGRGSTVKPSGVEVRRPNGQLMAAGSTGAPGFGPCRELDLELEMAVWLGRPSDWGVPIPITQAHEHIAGYGLLNDWSARDIQRWEMKPLGPFLAKNFGTTVSPWVLTPYALAPFRVAMEPRPAGDPAPLPHLLSAQDQQQGTFDVALEVHLRTRKMRSDGADSIAIIRSNMRYLYWTPQQMLTHHASAGCEMLSGDLIGTGTISGPRQDELGSLLELTENGAREVTLPNGEIRSYLHDGDEVTLRGRCSRAGFVSIGFGDCAGTIVPAIS